MPEISFGLPLRLHVTADLSHPTFHSRILQLPSLDSIRFVRQLRILSIPTLRHSAVLCHSLRCLDLMTRQTRSGAIFSPLSDQPIEVVTLNFSMTAFLKQAILDADLRATALDQSPSRDGPEWEDYEDVESSPPSPLSSGTPSPSSTPSHSRPESPEPLASASADPLPSWKLCQKKGKSARRQKHAASASANGLRRHILTPFNFTE
jgi:hypothetical protein